MKKILALLVSTGLFMHSAVAAPIGWYELEATWRDGQFSGSFLYDNTSPYLITQVSGRLTDVAQTTLIDRVWNPDNAQPESWVFLTNTRPAEAGGQDAGFYLNLVDTGLALELDTSISNGLFDWSHDYAFYNPGQLDDSPLLSYRLVSVNEVPEPATAGLLLAGLMGWVSSRRRRLPTC